MDATYIKLDLGYLIDSDWSAIEDYFRIDDSGIWLLEESAPRFRCLTQDERDLFMIHPERNPRFPVLPFPFTMNQFLKFADLPAIELHDFYLFADDTVDVVAIERLERMNAPAGALARALMFGELPKLAQLKEIQSEAASAYAAPVGAVGASLTHSTKARRDTLTPVVELAQSHCRNPKDTAEVWAVLMVLAEKKHPPLIGATEEGLQYLEAGQAGIFKRKSLGARLTR